MGKRVDRNGAVHARPHSKGEPMCSYRSYSYHLDAACLHALVVCFLVPGIALFKKGNTRPWECPTCFVCCCDAEQLDPTANPVTLMQMLASEAGARRARVQGLQPWVFTVVWEKVVAPLHYRRGLGRKTATRRSGQHPPEVSKLLTRCVGMHKQASTSVSA